MKQAFDTDSILFGIMKPAFAGLLSGGVYSIKRPDNSSKEDVVVNTITISQEFLPQIGVSNINIHVPDISGNIGGVQTNMPNVLRLKSLSEIALNAIRSANIKGLSISVEFQTIIEEPEIKQHYSNIRISWSIHN